MKLKSLHLATIILVFIFGSIATTSALGLWKTTTDKTPLKYKDGAFVGQYDPADIRGSYSFDDIFNSFEVPIEHLGVAFGVKDPANYALFQCKQLETLYASLAAEGKEIGTGSVKYFVALYKGLPITAEEPTYLPKSAVTILKAKAKLSDEQIKSIEKYSVELPDTSALPIISPVEKSASEKTIKATTTFKDLLGWGVKQVDIEKIIGEKLTDSSKILKEYATAKGIEYSTIKDPLQKLIDAVK